MRGYPGGRGSPCPCAPLAPGWCGYPQHPPQVWRNMCVSPHPSLGCRGITESFPGRSIRHLLLTRGERRVSCSIFKSRYRGIPASSPPLPKGPTPPPPPQPLGGFRRGAGQQGGRAGGCSHQRGRGAAGGLWGNRCRGLCRSSGCGPPAAPAAGSDGRWHSRWSAGCPGPLQSKKQRGTSGVTAGEEGDVLPALHQGQVPFEGCKVCFGRVRASLAPSSSHPGVVPPGQTHRSLS